MSVIVEQVFSMPAPFNLVAVIVIVVMGTGVITSVAREIGKYAAHRESVEIIRELAERGMSGDEIERVLRAGLDSHHAAQNMGRV